MTWIELLEVLDREYESVWSGVEGKCPTIPATPDPEDPRTSEHIRGLEEEADLACAYFAEHRRWPMMRHEVAWQIVHRLRECRAFAHFVVRPDTPRAAEDTEDRTLLPDAFLIRWVLCDFWRVAGIWRRIYRLRSPTDEEED